MDTELYYQSCAARAAKVTCGYCNHWEYMSYANNSYCLPEGWIFYKTNRCLMIPVCSDKDCQDLITRVYKSYESSNESNTTYST